MPEAERNPLVVNDLEYLEARGLNVMLAHDFYPEGHQGGAVIVQNGLRVAANGDLRLEPTPGQWSPIPKVGERVVDRETGEISVRMAYPDEARDRKGFNPIEYPDLHFAYTLKVRAEGAAFHIVVDLDEPIPEAWVGKVGLNIELFPGYLFGKSFALDGQVGIFPRQANGPSESPLATGTQLSVAPECDRQRMSIHVQRGGDLQLIDGRVRHNNGWFVVRSLVEGGATQGAIDWLVTPNAIPNWLAKPVVQVSQVGYHPSQPKIAVIELDRHDDARPDVELLRIDATGEVQTAKRGPGEAWGRFLRYDYLRFDFGDVQAPGMYIVRYGEVQSRPFKIGVDVYSRHVWQPTVDTFLPVQMCHMRIDENYRCWHGACHLDDAVMAPTDLNHVDGYRQGPTTMTCFASGERVPGLDRGGWHDAGDYDLRVESQSQTIHGLALAYEEFGLVYDDTTIDQAARVVELHRPDGKPDVLQQIEHGAIWIVGAYDSLGRLPRGVIERTLRQYTHLGDAATATDNVPGADDRWVFTDDRTGRELSVGAALAASSRALRGYDEDLAQRCLAVAMDLFANTNPTDPVQRFPLALELLQSTGAKRFEDALLDSANAACEKVDTLASALARSLALVQETGYAVKVCAALERYRKRVDERERETPYGVPYEPSIWGAGWGIQAFGVREYWLHKALPEAFPIDSMLHALNFVLGVHPGPNNASFVSGVGSHSMIPGYGVNRADSSYIPGGIGSGTALIRPDFAELLEWPYLWQQTEYCLGNPTSDYVFLVAAADYLLSNPKLTSEP